MERKDRMGPECKDNKNIEKKTPCDEKVQSAYGMIQTLIEIYERKRN